MGDAGEGLVDAESRVQERQEELERERAEKRTGGPQSPEAVETQRARESLRLARAELDRQLQATTHEARRAQLTHAIAEVDRRMSELGQGR